MSWQAAVEKTVTGLGYDLVDCERSAGGLLRVYIDKLAEAAAAGEVITVDDCEKVTRQLQYVLEVENTDYQRLEVSSPGVDRPLRKAADYARFAGQQVEITLKLAFQGRKKYRGELLAQEGQEAGGWRIVFNDGKLDQALDFTLDEVRDAKLVPLVNFKGRKAAGAAAGADDKTNKAAGKKAAKKKQSNAKARQQVDDEESPPAAAKDDKVDGGLDQ